MRHEITQRTLISDERGYGQVLTEQARHDYSCASAMA